MALITCAETARNTKQREDGITNSAARGTAKTCRWMLVLICIPFVFMARPMSHFAAPHVHEARRRLTSLSTHGPRPGRLEHAKANGRLEHAKANGTLWSSTTTASPHVHEARRRFTSLSTHGPCPGRLEHAKANGTLLSSTTTAPAGSFLRASTYASAGDIDLSWVKIPMLESCGNHSNHTAVAVELGPICLKKTWKSLGHFLPQTVGEYFWVRAWMFGYTCFFTLSTFCVVIELANAFYSWTRCPSSTPNGQHCELSALAYVPFVFFLGSYQVGCWAVVIVALICNLVSDGLDFEIYFAWMLFMLTLHAVCMTLRVRLDMEPLPFLTATKRIMMGSTIANRNTS